jgi:soluble lytic murein transglycosylase
LLRFLTVCIVVLLSTRPAPGADWRLEFTPRDPSEDALRDAVEREDASERLAALVDVAEGNPGTLTAGLARLAAGLLLISEERPEEALEQLAHRDVQRTALRDHALHRMAEAQEALERLEPAAHSYLAAAKEPNGTVACATLPPAASLLRETNQLPAAAEALEETIARCPRGTPAALLALADVRRSQGDRAAAAAILDRLDREHPASPEAREAQPMLRALARYLPSLSNRQRAQRRLDKGDALLGAGRTRDALDTLRRVNLGTLAGEDVNRARVLLGRALLARRRRSEGRGVLSKVPPDSAWGAEAAWHVARENARRTRSVAPYEAMADAFPGTPWAQRALRAAANHYQKDALDEDALPWWRRLLDEYPDGLYTESAAWRVGWAEYRAKRFAQAGHTWERTARMRPPGSATPGLLYWAGRAHLAQGELDRARWLLQETVQRFKHTYHGLRARQQLSRLGISPAAPAPPPPPGSEPSTHREGPLPGPRPERLRQLLLIDRLDEAAAELRRMGRSTRVRATLAWVEWRRGRFLQAIDVMKNAFPHWATAAGDYLPQAVWRILFPLPHEEELVRQASEEGLDPSLVAGLILQESGFEADAVSRVGARGLMQLMPTTGRQIARQKRLRFRTSALNDPRTSLDFGTHYLRRMSDRFDGAVDKVLVGYNAGPHRVDTWTSLRPGLPEEEFIETIPFTETRFYVRHVLANREAYRRLYRLGPHAPGGANGGGRP